MIILLVLTLTLGSDAVRCHYCQNKVPYSDSVEGVPCFDKEVLETSSDIQLLCEARRFCVMWTFTDGRKGGLSSLVVKVRGGGLSPPCFDFAPRLLKSEPSLPTAGPKLSNSTKNHNVRCRINKF